MKELLDKIVKDNTTGSHKLTVMALEAIKDFLTTSSQKDKIRLADELNEVIKDLVKPKKNIILMQKKASAVLYYFKRLTKTKKEITEIIKNTCDKIDELIAEANENQKKVGELGAKLIFTSNKILTISSSSLINNILITAHKNNQEFEVYCLESRPMLEGQEFAVNLAKAGIKTTVITDVMMGKMLSSVNLVLSGADRLYESGFVNKVGTFPLALTAYNLNVPFYVACETDKILKEIDRNIRFYPHDPAEVFNKKVKNLSVVNQYFEEIPYELVSKLICEEGVFEMHEFIKWYLKD